MKLISINPLHIVGLRMKFVELRAHRHEQIEEIKFDLKAGRSVTDFRFDYAVYPTKIIELSALHWTPVSAATMAAAMLLPRSNARILDVGSGVGKFCIVAGLSTQAHFTGIEIRPDLYEVAAHARNDFEADNVAFICGDMANLDWSVYDAFYLYNPFFETPANIRVANDEGVFRRSAEIAREKLAGCRKGTRVVTHHGFGGTMPVGYKIAEAHLVDTGQLELWIKEN